MTCKVIITGGCGFIGSNLCQHLNQCGYDLFVVDSCTYAAINRGKIESLGLPIYKIDIATLNWPYLLKEIRPNIIINLAAETFVDNSINCASEFIHSNYLGVYNTLNGINAWTRDNDGKILFLHFSTDEVYGDTKLNETKEFSETDDLHPNNPYSASKASADLLIQAMHRTYNSFDYVIVRPSNCYGPGQHNEKFIPTVINSILDGGKIPVYGNGMNMREWLFVKDLCKGIESIVSLYSFSSNPTTMRNLIFNLGSGAQRRNIFIVNTLIELMEASKDLISFVNDRPGHDLRYAIKSDKARMAFGWCASADIRNNLLEVIEDMKERRFNQNSSQ